MTCLLDRETYRRWERWFNHHRQMAMPDRYEMREYKNPYAKEIAAGKQLPPDPPPWKRKKEKLEKAPKPEATGLDADDIEELQQAEWDLKQVQRRVEDYVPYQSPGEERAAREKASARLERLNQIWVKAEKAAERARALDRVVGEEEK